MKLEKLLMLSLIVDAVDAYPLKGEIQFHTIKRGNDFLKQKPVKEMFVNEFGKKPVCNQWGGICNEYLEDLEKWEAAEKKVIFKDCEYFEDSVTINIQFADEYQLSYWKEDNPTLHAIAEATNGKLEIQNVIL